MRRFIGIGLGGVWGLDVLTKITPMGKLDRDTSSLLPLIIKCRNNGYVFGVIWIPIHVGKEFIAAAAFIKMFGGERDKRALAELCERQVKSVSLISINNKSNDQWRHSPFV